MIVVSYDERGTDVWFGAELVGAPVRGCEGDE